MIWDRVKYAMEACPERFSAVRDQERKGIGYAGTAKWRTGDRRKDRQSEFVVCLQPKPGLSR